MKNIKTLKEERLNQETITKKGYVIKCIIYNSASDIVVEFQDEYKAKVHTSWQKFMEGEISNPYQPNIYGGIVGNKYPSFINNERSMECRIWHNMLERCFSQLFKEKRPTYRESTCCNDWILFENFYEWLHSQENFDILVNSNVEFALDKDILIKGNKIYSPETCCLVPIKINGLFIKRDNDRGKHPIGVSYHKASNSFIARCMNQNCERIHLGCYDTPEKAFQAYKYYKENLIKQVAQEEYDKGNIIEKCYNAMINYKVEITD